MAAGGTELATAVEMGMVMVGGMLVTVVKLVI